MSSRPTWKCHSKCMPFIFSDLTKNEKGINNALPEAAVDLQVPCYKNVSGFVQVC